MKAKRRRSGDLGFVELSSVRLEPLFRGKLCFLLHLRVVLHFSERQKTAFLHLLPMFLLRSPFLNAFNISEYKETSVLASPLLPPSGV